MRIERAQRPPRGVQQLMYVGDDLAGFPLATRDVWGAVAVGGGLLAAFGKGGTRQLGMAAGAVGALLAYLSR